MIQVRIIVLLFTTDQNGLCLVIKKRKKKKRKPSHLTRVTFRFRFRRQVELHSLVAAQFIHELLDTLELRSGIRLPLNWSEIVSISG